MANILNIGYNPGSGAGHVHANPDAAGWVDAYQHIGPGATASVNGSPFPACVKLFDNASGYPQFPNSWANSIARTLAANNGGQPLLPLYTFGSNSQPSSLIAPTTAAIVAFLQSLPTGQKAAFTFGQEQESGSDFATPSAFLIPWGNFSANMNAALAQMGGAPFWTRANFPLITSSYMAFYKTSTSNVWQPPRSQVDAYGNEFYQHFGPGTSENVGAKNDPRFQNWLTAVKSVAGTNVPLAFTEYGLGMQTYTAATEAQRQSILAQDFAYINGSSGPSGSAPFVMWMYWYQMDASPNFYCFPLANGTETQAQAIATVNTYQSIIAAVGGGPPQTVITVTNPGNQAGLINSVVSLPIIAVDSNPALPLTYSATGLPTGTKINASTGLITGTLTALGSFNVTVTVADGTGTTGTTAFTWTVTSSATEIVTVINPGSQIQWLLGVNAGFEGSLGTWVVDTNCTIADSTAQAHSGQFSMAITSVAAGNAAANASSTQAIIAPGQVVTFQGWFRAATVARTCEVLLNWLRFDQTFINTVSVASITDSTTAWTFATGTAIAPANAAFAQFIARVDATGAGGETHYYDDTFGSTGPDIITPAHTTVNLAISASDNLGNVLSYAATGLPTGLSIAPASGVISGVPTTPGAFSVTVTVTSTTSVTGTASFVWVINASAVTVNNPGTQTSITNEHITPLQITATDTANAAVSFSAVGLPTGLSISAAGLITGTATVAGTYTPTITGTDSFGSTGTAGFTWNVSGTTLTVVNPGPLTNNLGDVVSQLIVGIDSAANPLTWAATNLPPGLSIAAATGLITGTITGAGGGFRTTITATDAIPPISASADFLWTVTVTQTQLAISIAPQPGQDIFGNPYPAGVTVGADSAQQTTIAMNGLLHYTAPVFFMPAPVNGWTVGGSARLLVDALGSLVIAWRDLVPGTVADGTLVWPIGALPPALRPDTKRRIVCYCDATVTGGAPVTAAMAALELRTDGSVACYGIAATATRVALFGTFPIRLP